VASRSKQWVCGSLLAGIVGSNLSGFMDVLSLVSVVCFQVEISASADHSSRGVLPSEVYLSECDCESSIMKRPWPTTAVAPW
jgi:hypothetical protein